MGKPTRQIENTAPEEADEEDNRDIFEKALDYAPLVIGAAIGGAAGRNIVPKMIKRKAAKELEKGPPKGVSKKEWADDMKYWVEGSKSQGTALGGLMGTTGGLGVMGVREFGKDKKRRK